MVIVLPNSTAILLDVDQLLNASFLSELIAIPDRRLNFSNGFFFQIVNCSTLKLMSATCNIVAFLICTILNDFHKNNLINDANYEWEGADSKAVYGTKKLFVDQKQI
jgi:hypothetical protein